MARPRTGKAMTAAGRMRRSRVRRRDAGVRKANAWKRARTVDEVLAKVGLIRTLAHAHGATSVELFGSAARGEDAPASDLDFMVELEPGRSLLDLVGFSQDMEAALGRKVEAFTKAGLKPRILAEARKEAIRIV